MSNYNEHRNGQTLRERREEPIDSRSVFEGYLGPLPDRHVHLLLSDITRVSNGTFGVVYMANLLVFLKNDIMSIGVPSETSHSERVAVKRVLQDKRYKNRELEITRIMDHPNIISLNFTRENRKRGVVLDESVLKSFAKQLLSAMDYIHQMSICHRDIKPQNILLTPDRSTLKICDFGRHYRAPELIMEICDYTTVVDIWACGCVLAEAVTGTTLFDGETSIDQMYKIQAVLKIPDSCKKYLNKTECDFELDQYQPHGHLNNVLKCKYPDFVQLIEKMLTFYPCIRPSSSQLLKERYLV